MDDTEMIDVLRAQGETLKAQMLTLEDGPQLERCRRALSFTADLILAIATGDQAAKDALLLESEIELALMPRRRRLN